MKFSTAISEVQRRLSRNRNAAGVLFLVAGGGFAALAFMALAGRSLTGAFCAALALCAAAIFVVWKKHFFSGVSRYDAAQVLDQRFATSERAVSYVEIENSGGWADPRAEILISQLEERIPEFSVNQLLPFKISRRQKVAFSLGLFSWLSALVILLLWNPFFPRSLGARDAEMIQELLRHEKEIPPELRQKLEELAHDLRKEQAGSEKLRDSLGAAQQELQNTVARQGEGTAGEKGAEKRDEPVQSKPTPTRAASSSPVKPTPTPTAQPEQQSAKGEEQKKQDQQSKEDQSKQGQQGQSEKSKDSQQGKDDKGQQGQGKQDQNQSGTGSGQNKDPQQQDKQGQGKEGDQQNQQQGQGKEGSQQDQQQSQGKEGKEGKEQQSQGANQGQDQQNKALQKTEQALNQIKENMEKQSQGSEQKKQDGSSEQKGEAGKQNQSPEGQKQDQAGQSKTDQQKGNGEKKDQESKPGQKGESKAADKKSEPAKEGQSSEAAKEAAEQKVFEEKKAGKSSLASPEEQERRRGQSPLGDKETDNLGGQKGYRDIELNPQGEKLDESQTGNDAGTSGERVETRPRTSLADVELARPETVKEKASQPVPLEYRDLLR